MAGGDEAVRSSCGEQRGREGKFAVINELPDPLPVSEAELDILERELATFIATFLGR
jgi:hypothetical protein